MLLLAVLLATSGSIRVCDLDLSRIKQGWGEAVRDQSVTHTPLSVGGRAFAYGIGTHANSSFRLVLDGKGEWLDAQVGVDDNAKSERASIVFRVVGDGKEIWKSPVVHWKDAPLLARVNLRGVHRLTLTADDAGDGIDHDHADWCNPVITYSGSAPKAFVPEPETERILTPPSSPAPRINGPSAIGARPGHEFLYKLPVTGIRPMRFEVRGLPTGLRLLADGRIVGVTPSRGTYHLQVSASNAKGVARRTLRLVAGDEIALTPHMGWNSWYVWLGSVSDAKMRAAADAFVRYGLDQHGWTYVNIDDCWARVPGNGPTRDSQGRILPGDGFPDMRGLTDYIHSKGLKAGIYTSPGPTTCAGFEGAFGHEATDAQTFADWGFDFLKYDWCSYRPDRDGLDGFKYPYVLMGELLRHQKRDIVLNLCQYGMGKVWQWGKGIGGHSWRTAGDLGIGYTLFEDGFGLYANEHLERFAGPGAFNDPDYLLFGQVSAGDGKTKKTPFTPNEQYTQMSFWCLIAAPLIFSGDVSNLDPFTLNLLTNDEVIAVDQDSLVKAARRISKVGDGEVWSRPLEDGSQAIGLFNVGDDPVVVRTSWIGKKRVRDLWKQKDLGAFVGGYQARVPRHGVVLLKVR